MDPGVVAIIAAAAAVVSALFAGWQAFEARRARRGSARAEVRAGEQADRAFGQADRAANAQESIALAIRSLREPAELWDLRPGPYPGSAHLVNVSGRTLVVTRATITDQHDRAYGGRGTWLMSEQATWPKGYSEPVTWPENDDRLSSPLHWTLTVYWREVDDEDGVLGETAAFPLS